MGEGWTVFIGRWGAGGAMVPTVRMSPVNESLAQDEGSGYQRKSNDQPGTAMCLR